MGLGLLVDHAAHHHADDVVHGHVGHVPRVHIAPVAHDRHAVGDDAQLLHAVGDVDDAHALGLQPADEREQILDFRFGQRRGRLVHDENARVAEGQRLGDFHHLLLGDGEGAHAGSRADVAQMERIQQRVGLRVLSGLVQEQSPRGLAADVDVFGHGQILHQVDFLMDDADAQMLRFQSISDVDFPAVQRDSSSVADIDAGEDLHQRGLAGTVFTHQRVHLARAEIKPAVVQRVDAGEIFLDSPHFQHRLIQGVPSSYAC